MNIKTTSHDFINKTQKGCTGIFYQIKASAQVSASGIQLPLDKPEEEKFIINFTVASFVKYMHD